LDKSPEQRLGQLIYRSGERATAIVKAGAIALTGGELLRVGDNDGELTVADSGDIVVAVLGDGQTIQPNTSAYAAVYYLGNVFKLRAAGQVQRGSWVKAGIGGSVVQAETTVSIPSGAVQVSSTSAQPSMVVEGFTGIGVALDEAETAGDFIRVVMK